MSEAIGVTIPIVRGQIGYFQQTRTTLQAARSNLLNLLLTNKGERLMQPEFGTDIYRLLFEQVDIGIDTQVEEDIRSAVSFWLPYIIIRDVKVDASTDNIDRNRLDISTTFSIEQDPTTFETITFTVTT